VDAATARALASGLQVARLATVRVDGRPHAVPVTFALLGEAIVTAVDAKPKRSTRLRRLDNVRADARVAVLFDHYEDDWARLWWVRADGLARVVEGGAELERALAALAARYRQYRDVALTGPAIVIEVERWSGWTAAAAPGS
jgi:PPOX class probable F420-dependent enzyme